MSQVGEGRKKVILRHWDEVTLVSAQMHFIVITGCKWKCNINNDLMLRKSSSSIWKLMAHNLNKSQFKTGYDFLVLMKVRVLNFKKIVCGLPEGSS